MFYIVLSKMILCLMTGILIIVWYSESFNYSHRKEWNHAFYNNMDRFRGAKWNKSKPNIVWFHSYMGFKRQNKLTKEKRHTENRS